MRESSFIEKGVTTSHNQIMAFAVKEVVLLLVWCCLTYSNVQGNLFIIFFAFLYGVELSATQYYGIADCRRC